MLVSCLGDVMLDVIVSSPRGLVPDDDIPARIEFAAGGQAANVAAWVVALGGRARVFGPRSEDGPGRLATDALGRAGVELHGPLVERSGTVVSVVAGGTRSLASDPGTRDWLDEVAPGAWLDGADWLLVSGYALLRAAAPEHMVATAAEARAAGTSVAVDLSSAGMIRSYGAARFRALWRSLEPAVVFANDDEWAATNEPSDVVRMSPSAHHAEGRGVLVLKHGARGCTFIIQGVPIDRVPVPGPVVDVTGAGDALAAGYLLGGIEMAMAAAARCVAHVGAQPRAARET